MYLCYDVIVLYTDTQLTGSSRLQLAAIHSHNNVDVVSSKAQKKTVVFPNQKKGEPAVKTVSDEPKFGMTMTVCIIWKNCFLFLSKWQVQAIFRTFELTCKQTKGLNITICNSFMQVFVNVLFYTNVLQLNTDQKAN